MVEQLISEATDCDFKETVERSKPKSWLKSVSAFANGRGGAIVFGVEDGNHEVAGLADPQSDADYVSEAIKARLDPLPSFALAPEFREGKAILILQVDAGSTPPYYVCADGRREAFVRVGSQSSLAPAETLNELILRGTHRSWDTLDSRIPLERASFTVLRATFAQRTGKDMAEGDLASFGLITDDGTLTNAGALFTDEPLVRHSRLFCTRWGGIEKVEPVEDAEFSGSLLTLLREGEAFVKRHNPLAWRKTPTSRLDFRCYSERAVAESLVNGLVHRSYLDLGSEVHVDVYDDRLTVSSPGGMVKGPLPDDILGSVIESRRRNPVVCDVMARMNLMERRGTGLQEICRATAAEDAWQPRFMPRFEEERDSFRVTLWNMRYGISNTDEAVESVPESADQFPHGSRKIPEKFPKERENARIVPENDDPGRRETTAGRERKALSFLQEHPLATSSEVAVALGMTRRGTNRLLGRLIERGGVERIGTGRATRYRAIACADDSAEPDANENDETPTL